MGSSPIVFGLSPLERPDPSLVVAVCRAGGVGILDLGRDESIYAANLARVAKSVDRYFGVRIPEGVDIDPSLLPDNARVVILAGNVDSDAVSRWQARSVLVQVTSLGQARDAISAGAAGLIAKGNESGGRVAEETAFILLQRLVDDTELPTYVQGGVGLHTAAACIAGGAAGIVLDAQLALVRESTLADDVRSAIAAMDGSETTVVAGHRVYTRPDLPVASMGDVDEAAVLAKLGGDDLNDNLLPVGQDAAFASAFARRFRTAGGVIHAIRSAVASHIADANRHQPLAAGAPLAAAHGIEYPIVQGPMTRVSDNASFADAISLGGGLPFLSLSLMTGDKVGALLSETRDKLGERTWGVGILGFAPADIREQQLAALRENPPPVAIIAGGRPSQAKQLEQLGTASYLHVPSPKLLDLFLDQGARRFIFEGRECGGHVGPRSSFVLWETQIERLLQVERPEELHVLFAGGIHDARSAAMVTAMAAPLAARGARIGVLMGTAYLFTDEAVSTGAIKPMFQDNAVQCDGTVLLETAPGHATRCVDSQYVGTFTSEKDSLVAEGKPAKEMWKALEMLNLGRLRIASKGLRRDGDALVEVDDSEQQRDGMYMIGQVAALRSNVLSIADLHRDVSDASTRLLAKVVGAETATPRAPSTDVAIVGMACMFPGAADLDSYWSNIVHGRNSITEVSPERWNPDFYYDPEATGASAGRKTPSKWGGFLPKVDFDPLAYGIPPRSLASIEPVQLLSLEVARRALDDAGYADREFARENTSVIFGAEAGTDMSGAYGFRAMYPQLAGDLPEALDEHLPTLTEDSFPGVLSNVIAGRIANRLDLGGVNYTVDAACAASLAALDLSVKELSTGTSDMVLCGGADVHNSINDYLLFSSVHALSPTGQCRTFDSAADGIALGEGVACVVLKRLSDAERDGDRVYAVIKGVAGSSDGRSLGLTAPRKEGQKRALERAYDRAGVSPADVGLVEAHGTGTVVGDRTELATLTEVFTAAGAAPASCGLGSVKSQIGHTKCAAGMAGLIKVALSIHNKVKPPTLHISAPNSAYDADSSPFQFSSEARPWQADQRIGALSALGFGGTNFHAVLAEHDGPEVSSGVAKWPAELFVFRGADRATASRAMDQLAATVASDSVVRLRDLAKTVAAGEGPVQVALVATDAADLLDKLSAARSFDASVKDVFVADQAGEQPTVAFMFPGQGSQRPGMLSELFVAFPRLQEYLAIGADVVDRMFPPSAFSPEQDRARKLALTDTRVAQPALGIADMAMAEVLRSLGVRPDMAAGHSYGELVALCDAGVFSAEELIAISVARAACILDAAGDDPGTMAAVSAPASDVQAALDAANTQGVVIANHNSPRQTVISGPTAAIESAVAKLSDAGLSARAIPVACAFHSPVVAAASETLADCLAEVSFAQARHPVWSNKLAAPYPTCAVDAAAILASQVASPVRFAEQVQRMYDAGARVFVEVGPGRTLSKLVGKILGDAPHTVVATDEPGKGLRGLLSALGQLAVEGVDVDVTMLFAGRDCRELDLAKPPAGPSKSAWQVDGYTAKPRNGQARAGAFKSTPKPVAVAVAQTAAPTVVAGDERTATMLEYLRGMREMVSAQRDVMLGYLGAPVMATATVVPATATPIATLAAEAPVAVVPEPAAPVDLKTLLLGVVSDRTGYPVEMLDLDLDLEAELSIDSIKRIEIIGELSQKIGLASDDGDVDEELVEQLAAIKTLRGIIDWLSVRNEVAATESPATPADTEEPPVAAEVAPTDPAPVLRYLVRPAPAPEPALNGHSLDGRDIVVIDDGRGIATALADALLDHGAKPRIVHAIDELGAVDGLIDLRCLAEDVRPDVVKDMFRVVRQALLGGAFWVMGVTPFGHPVHGAELGYIGGVSGMLKAAAREFDEARVRVVNVDPAADPAALAQHLRTELLTADEWCVEVGYRDGERYVLRSAVAELDVAGADQLDLTGSSVVLLTGGARGITARVAVELAQRYKCRLALVGRSPEPSDDEPADVRDATDTSEVRRALVARGLRDHAEIERQCHRILADREMRATFREIAAAGAQLTYHAVDVRDAGALGQLIDELYEQFGRIDGVIHGAGVTEDKLIRDKTDESFARVFDTKVVGAMTLAAKLRRDTSFVVFFGSVSGVFGNRGQVDYAAANDVLDKLAWSLDRHLDGRVVSIDWGPWGGAGMVRAELEREYARRGVSLIDLHEGVRCLIDELRFGQNADSQVLLIGAEPALLGEAQLVEASVRG